MIDTLLRYSVKCKYKFNIFVHSLLVSEPKYQITVHSGNLFTANRDLSVMECCLKWFLPRFLSSKLARYSIVIGLSLSMVFAAVSVYNIPRKELYSMYFEDASPIGEFFDARSQFYPFSLPLAVIVDKQLDYSDIHVNRTIESLAEDMEKTGVFEFIKVCDILTLINPGRRLRR